MPVPGKALVGARTGSMCDNAAAGAVALLLLILNGVLRNPGRLWPFTQVVVALGAIVSLPGPLLRLGFFGVPGVRLCLDSGAQTLYLWAWATCIFLFAVNFLWSLGHTRRAKKS